MGTSIERKIVLVTRKTRIDELKAKHQTLAQAKFYVEHLGADFDDYRREHDAYAAAKQLVVAALRSHGRFQAIDRAFLTNFLFAPDDIVVALGQDGLVANTMKYLDGQPLVGVNPDPHRYDGVLLPFEARDVARLLPELLSGRRDHKSVTMAKATLADRQALYAVNDLFIGPRSHTSARYEIRHGDAREVQLSSGIIVSTGLGSTGWMTSVVTGAVGIAARFAAAPAREPLKVRLPWDAQMLRFAVREPFPSKSSQAAVLFGEITRDTSLRLTSLMPENGVIFSDGIEADYLDFNAGANADIAIAERTGRLVV